MRLYRVKIYRALFAVRPEGKHTTKTLPCVFLAFAVSRNRGFPVVPVPMHALVVL
jgi:hypothetical protein